MKRFLPVLALAILALASVNCIGGKDNAAAPSAAPSAAPAAAPATPAVAQPVKVSLRWDKPVDMDLEIWNAAGQNLIHRAFPGEEGWKAENCGADVKDGTQGEEFFLFKKTQNEDFSSGEFVVSVYFAAREENSTIDAANATVTITKADGTTESISRMVRWTPGEDQWHAVKINATTGAIVERIDRMIKLQQNE